MTSLRQELRAKRMLLMQQPCHLHIMAAQTATGLEGTEVLFGRIRRVTMSSTTGAVVRLHCGNAGSQAHT
jgi:hypothetical protein